MFKERKIAFEFSVRLQITLYSAFQMSRPTHSLIFRLAYRIRLYHGVHRMPSRLKSLIACVRLSALQTETSRNAAKAGLDEDPRDLEQQ